MSDQVQGLDEPCSVCRRISGEHTLREWSVCLGTVTTDLPYEPVPEDAARVAREQLGAQFGIPDDWIVADNVVAKALWFDGASGPVRVRVPVVLQEFSVATPDGLVQACPSVAFIGSPETARKFGRLIRDTANGAANAAEGGRR